MAQRATDREFVSAMQGPWPLLEFEAEARRAPSRTGQGALALVLLSALILLAGLFPAESARAQTAPRVNDIDFIGMAHSGDTYRLGEKIRVLVTFDKDVTVDRSLAPFIRLEVGSRSAFAWYFGGIGGLAGFEYFVQDGDMDTDGVSIPANAISGTIVDAADGTTAADLTYPAVPDNPLHKVNGTRPEPGVTVWPRTRDVPEGGTASYQVTLDSQPFGSVTVSVAPAADSDPDLGVTPARLTFTAANWNAAQTVTVSAADDQDGTDGTATFGHTATSPDPAYDGIEVADVAATENDDEFAHFMPFFPAASSAVQGFARIINRSDEAGDVHIFGIDDNGKRHGPAVLALSELESAHFNSGDLETGNPDKGLTRLGNGAGNWRLEFATQLRILPLAYIRTEDGFVTAMQDVAQMSTGEERHRALRAVLQPRQQRKTGEPAPDRQSRPRGRRRHHRGHRRPRSRGGRRPAHPVRRRNAHRDRAGARVGRRRTRRQPRRRHRQVAARRDRRRARRGGEPSRKPHRTPVQSVRYRASGRCRRGAGAPAPAVPGRRPGAGRIRALRQSLRHRRDRDHSRNRRRRDDPRTDHPRLQ